MKELEKWVLSSSAQLLLIRKGTIINMAWHEAVVTNKGLELLTECILSGGSIEITSAEGGESCSPAVSLMAVKELNPPVHNLQLAKTEKIKNFVTVNIRVQNNGLAEAYTIRQIGIFARIKGSAEQPVLLALIQDKDGEIIPDETENPEFLLEYDFVIPVDNGENISVSVTPSTFATLEDLNEHIRDNVRHLTGEERAKWNSKAEGDHTHAELENHIKNTSNPHNVTKAQVGLGNVPNVATNDQTPTYTAAAALSELTSGEKLSAAFGKLAKGVKDLIVHLADNVRHVTAAERTAWNGKAAGNHTHDAASSAANGFMSAADKTKLDGIATGANKYTHPTTAGNKHIPSGGASGQILRWSSDGTAEWGADNNTTYSNMTAATASAAGKAGLVPAPAAGAQAKYLRGDGTWQTPPDTNTTYAAATQSANGLMSAADKKKLDGIAAAANNYAHPTTAGNKHIPAGGASGQILRWSADGTAEWGADNNTTYSNMTAATASAAGKAGLVPAPAAGAQTKYLRGDGTWQTPPDTNTTYAAATQSANGLMSAADKKKLDGIAASANNYAHPTTAGNKHIPAGGSSGQILRWSSDGTAEWGADNNTTYSNMTAATASAAGKAGLVPAPAAGAQTKYLRGDGTWQTPPDTNTTYSAATQSANGLMSAADKKKLDGIAASANNYAHPTTAGNKHIPAGGSSGQILRWSADGTAEWGADNNTTYTPASAAPKAAGTAAVGTSAKYAREDHVHPLQTTVSGNAGTATKLAAAKTVDGVSFDGTANITHYGTCSTAAATAAKAVALTGFVLDTGAEVTVKFTVTNTAANPTLNVNSTGAKAIYYRGAAIAAGYLAANRTYTFRYNGTQYDLVGDIDTNTTYSAATQSANGLMSAADKTKLDGIAENANSYTHPSYTARTGVPTANQTPAFGSTFSVTQPVSNASGHITAMNTRTVKIPNTTASASAAGLMSAADKAKLDGFGVSKIAATYGKTSIYKATGSLAFSTTVTIPHAVDFIVLHSNYSNDAKSPIGMLTPLNTSCGVSYASASLGSSASSATITFTNNTTTSNFDIFYAAIKLS